MLTRRLFLAGAALAAPAIVRSQSLMKLWVPPKPRFVYDPEVLPFDFSDIQPWKVWVADDQLAWVNPVSVSEFWPPSSVTGREHVAKHQAANARLRDLLFPADQW